MPMYNNICKVCSKTIRSYMSNKLVCSKECRMIANREYARGFMCKKREGQKIVCIRCKNEFTTYHLQKNVCLACQMKY